MLHAPSIDTDTQESDADDVLWAMKRGRIAKESEDEGLGAGEDEVSMVAAESCANAENRPQWDEHPCTQ